VTRNETNNSKRKRPDRQVDHASILLHAVQLTGAGQPASRSACSGTCSLCRATCTRPTESPPSCRRSRSCSRSGRRRRTCGSARSSACASLPPPSSSPSLQRTVHAVLHVRNKIHATKKQWHELASACYICRTCTHLRRRAAAGRRRRTRPCGGRSTPYFDSFWQQRVGEWLLAGHLQMQCSSNWNDRHDGTVGVYIGL